ncbi:hypothetical protein FQR65_LT07367 [Abscondita terminalis]|nr:hypothetical protein FQR65_LT07367 [Abscondita terminalis]
MSFIRPHLDTHLRVLWRVLDRSVFLGKGATGLSTLIKKQRQCGMQKTSARHCTVIILSLDPYVEHQGTPSDLRSQTGAFDFKLHCIFCGGGADNQKEKKKAKRYRKDLPVRTTKRDYFYPLNKGGTIGGMWSWLEFAWNPTSWH